VVKVTNNRPHCCHTFQWYLPGGASVHPQSPPYTYSLGPPKFKSQTASQSVQPSLHSSWQKVAMLYNGPPFFPLKIAPSHRGIWTSWFIGTTHQVLSPNGILIGSAVSAQLTAVCPYTLQWAAPPPSKLSLLMRDLDPHLIHGFLGSPESSTQTASGLVQPFFQGSQL